MPALVATADKPDRAVQAFHHAVQNLLSDLRDNQDFMDQEELMELQEETEQ